MNIAGEYTWTYGHKSGTEVLQQSGCIGSGDGWDFTVSGSIVTTPEKGDRTADVHVGPPLELIWKSGYIYTRTEAHEPERRILSDEEAQYFSGAITIAHHTFDASVMGFNTIGWAVGLAIGRDSKYGIWRVDIYLEIVSPMTRKFGSELISAGLGQKVGFWNDFSSISGVGISTGLSVSAGIGVVGFEAALHKVHSPPKGGLCATSGWNRWFDKYGDDVEDCFKGIVNHPTVAFEVELDIEGGLETPVGVEYEFGSSCTWLLLHCLGIFNKEFCGSCNVFTDDR